MIEKILKKYQTSIEGLNQEEVNYRLKKYGYNELKEEKKKHSIVLFLMQFKDFLIGLLIAAAIIAYLVGDIIDSYVILIVVFLNAIIGFIQEYRAEKAIEELKSLISTKAIVKRNNNIQVINSKELTIGDIVILEEGAKIPADLLLIETNELKIDESSLTGESEPISKSANYNNQIPLDTKNRKFESNIAYMDSTVIKGNAIGVVFSIGMNTSIGKIALMIQQEETETFLQKKVNKLGKTLSLIAISVCIFIFIVETIRGSPIINTFMTSVSLAVAAVPEGLPAVLTLTLALGMQKMTQINAVVRKLFAVETLGSCTIICSDKTGTLTKNKMTVKESKIYNENFSNLNCSLCNNSYYKNKTTIGNPTDKAILNYAYNKGFIKKNLEEKYPRIKEIPLDSIRKRMTTIHKYGSKDIIFTKGAPEIILKHCKYIDQNGNIEILDDDKKKNITNEISKMTNSTLRTIGLAYKIYNYNTNLEDQEIESELIFTGIIGMKDPPRDNVKLSIKKCKQAGINVKMITGDHKDTATSIAREIGILTDGIVITGEELEKLPQEKYLKIVDKIQVYARAYPEQKMRIIETLQNKKNIVSMTGDGVNDAPALKKASIGVAMGSGTDVAKEAADMIIQDDNFTTIIKAIKEGRKIYDNIKRFVKFQLSTNIGALITILGSSFIALPLPFNPVQLLWINIIMDGPPAQTLGMEKEEKNIMNRNPETGDILNKKILIKISIAGIIMAIGTLCLFNYKLNNGSTKNEAMTAAFTLFVIYQLFNAYNSKSNSNKKNIYLYLAILISFILQLIVIYIPYLQKIFKTTPLSLTDWILIFLIACTILISHNIVNKIIPEE